MKKSMRRAVISVIVSVLILLSAACAVFIFSDHIVSFAINNFTDYRISYAKWAGSPLDRGVLTSPVLELKNKGITLMAEKAEFELNAANLFKSGEMSIECRFVNATLALKGVKANSDDVFGIILSPGQVFGEIKFSVIADARDIAVKSLSAESKDIRVKGDYFAKNDNTYVALDVKLSVSPDLASMISEDVRSGILTLGDDGWYSAVIDYKGNPLFLKALYMVTTPS